MVEKNARLRPYRVRAKIVANREMIVLAVSESEARRETVKRIQNLFDIHLRQTTVENVSILSIDVPMKEGTK